MNSGNIEAIATVLKGIENALDIILESADGEITSLKRNEAHTLPLDYLAQHLNALHALSMSLHHEIEEINTEVNKAMTERARA